MKLVIIIFLILSSIYGGEPTLGTNNTKPGDATSPNTVPKTLEPKGVNLYSVTSQGVNGIELAKLTDIDKSLNKWFKDNGYQSDMVVSFRLGSSINAGKGLAKIITFNITPIIKYDKDGAYTIGSTTFPIFLCSDGVIRSNQQIREFQVNGK